VRAILAFRCDARRARARALRGGSHTSTRVVPFAMLARSSSAISHAHERARARRTRESASARGAGGRTSARVVERLNASARVGRSRARARVKASVETYDVDEVDYRGNLCLFLDSASEETWNAWLPTGLFVGVTTNPAILERDGVECSVESLSELARNALEFDSVVEFQVQTWGADSDEMWKNGIALAKRDPDAIVVKVPATLEGIKAANALVSDGVRVTITAAYAPHQVLVAAAIGANYVAPYLGRMNDAGRDGMGTIIAMQETVDALESDMRILVASVRTAAELSKLAAKGCDTFTISEKVAAEMFSDPLTTQAALDFENAAARMAPKPPREDKKKVEKAVEVAPAPAPVEEVEEVEEVAGKKFSNDIDTD